jgi:hypothetical protein
MTTAQAAAVKLIPWLEDLATSRRMAQANAVTFEMTNAYAADVGKIETLLAFLEEAKGMAPEDDAERLRKALEDIALLDEADGHELRKHHAFEAVAIATRALGKHPSEIFHARKITRGSNA